MPEIISTLRRPLAFAAIIMAVGTSSMGSSAIGWGESRGREIRSPHRQQKLNASSKA